MEMNIEHYLQTCRELSQLTTQNGWIDNDTLKITILSTEENSVVVEVRFDELIMEGSGCLADRIKCYGQVRLQLDENDHIINMEIL
ncbi:MAG: hypothetical protein DRR16_14175 [Candidatus Parabeggiatoa sp. nov. 3]|nr:MAG: hypothetical protein DRR00_09165 [Gammaproteobacteria bacterium]RKZ64541.1 MAG: hypothetical protein DRQ99_15355 [Gammaproteobacteria bacterium]RKZ84645.1 MAG: hypothetical protein DRR16_14175 [Gammaproteobacteria bacterium]HEW98336.1 hypothetical protein [Beggiatoa sp.]